VIPRAFCPGPDRLLESCANKLAARRLTISAHPERSRPDEKLDDLYRHRFPPDEHAGKEGIWRVLAPALERRFPDGPILDVGCDRGYFVRNLGRSQRWATDIRDMAHDLPAGVRFVRGSGLDLAGLVPAGFFAGVFMSNYLEHLPSSDDVVEQLRVAHAVLRPGGRLVILQPNIRLVGPAYWDFIDHHVALTERSLVEAAELAGLRTVEVRTRFLPYSTKSRLAQHPALVRAYLAFPPAWWLLGKQTLYVGERPG
jgi:SAM-dependent methyltransferase